jgi:integrase
MTMATATETIRRFGLTVEKITRPDGSVRYRARPDAALRGEPRRQPRVTAPTLRELGAELARIRADRDRGQLPVPRRDTVNDLIEAYLAAHDPHRGDPARYTLRRHLRLPAARLGARLAWTVTPDDVRALVKAAGQPGAAVHHDGGAPARRAALADAVRRAGRPVTAAGLAGAVPGRPGSWVTQNLALLAAAGVIRKLGRGLWAALPGDDGTAPTPASACARQPDAPLAPATVQAMLWHLRRVFDQAIGDRKLPGPNPCDGVRAPSVRRRPVAERAWTRAQWHALLEVADADRLAACWRLLAYGLRASEVLGLTWDAVDLDGDPPTVTVGQARVRLPGPGGRTAVKETKTGAGERVLPLEPHLRAALAGLRRAQLAEQVRAGPDAYRPSGFVAADELGRPVDPRRFSWMLGKIRGRAGLPPLRTRNGLRHTANTLMAEAGVPLHVRAAWCGHTEAMNARTYTHPADVASAAEAMAGLCAPPAPAPPRRPVAARPAIAR